LTLRFLRHPAPILDAHTHQRRRRYPTPTEIIDKFNKEINIALADPKMTTRLADLGNTAFPGSPADLGRFVADDTEKWAKVIQTANIKPD
jgi:tripartite-type tricarboxylate transporter receptor subunit TctC